MQQGCPLFVHTVDVRAISDELLDLDKRVNDVTKGHARIGTSAEKPVLAAKMRSSFFLNCAEA